MCYNDLGIRASIADDQCDMRDLQVPVSSIPRADLRNGAPFDHWRLQPQEAIPAFFWPLSLQGTTVNFPYTCLLEAAAPPS